MKCPRDGWELRRCQIDGVPAFRCPRCNGILLELGQSERVTLDPVKFKAAAWNSLENGTLISPVSGNPMRVFRYRGVELDYCEESQSIWLDRGELDKITRADPTKLKGNSSSAWIDGVDALWNSGYLLEFVFEAVGSVFD